MAPEKTPLEKWAEYGWLNAEPTSPREIANLLSIVTGGADSVYCFTEGSALGRQP